MGFSLHQAGFFQRFDGALHTVGYERLQFGIFHIGTPSCSTCWRNGVTA